MNKNVKKGLLIAAAVLLAAILIYAIWFVSSIKNSFDNLAPKDDMESLDTAVEKGAFNVLLIGKDKSDFLTDTMMMINVDLSSKEISIVSLMRDTRVKLGKNAAKLNAVYGRDKMNGLIACIKELTGAPIHYYVMVDLEGFVNIIDYLGGVEFDVPRDMKYSDPYQSLKINLKKGLQHLDGEKAMQLVRFRQYREGDVERTRVQKDFIKALIEQKLKPEYLLKLPDIFREASKYVETNATLGDVIKKSSALKLFSNTDSVEIYEMPGVGTYIGKISYYVHDQKETYKLFEEHFMGTGAPTKKVYTDYASLPAPRPSVPAVTPPATQQPEPSEPEVENPPVEVTDFEITPPGNLEEPAIGTSN